MATDPLIRKYACNGVIDTSKPVWKNIENIANSAGSWVTYDSTTGKYEAVVNQAGTSAHSFTDTNIIGAIKVNGTGINELYNSVEVQFPLTDVKDSSDYVTATTPSVDLKQDEPDNKLSLTYPLVNNPLQAIRLGLLELKQSRVDLIVEITTDFHENDVKAGELIDITNDIFGWTNKIFRVLQVKEVDNSKDLLYTITALEYDADVYTITQTELDYYNVTDEDGINTIGAIGQCSTPSVTKTLVDRKPHMLVQTTLPTGAGVIEGVEIWYYKIPDSELSNWQNIDDTARTYENIFTVRPPGNQKVFALGSDVSHDISTLEAGNYLFKVRAVNSVTSGPFSSVMGSYEAFVPKQTTDNITNNTEVDEGSGNILTTLGSAGLIGFINSLMRDGAGGSGSMFEKIFSVFNTEEGFSLNDSSIKQVANTTGSPQISVATGSHDTGSNLGTTSGTTLLHTVYFTPSYSGNYVVQTLFDGKGSFGSASDVDLRGFRGIQGPIVNSVTGNLIPDPTPGAPSGSTLRFQEGEDTIQLAFILADASGTLSTQGTGGPGVAYWQDFILSDTVALTAGTQYALAFYYSWQTDYAASTSKIGFDLSYNVFSTL